MMHDNADRSLKRRLRNMWETADPEPGDLADRVLFVLQLEDVEYELLRLRETREPQGARGSEGPRTVSFSNDSLSVMVALIEPAPGRRRLDGYIVPAAALRVELRTAVGPQHTRASTAGRFAFPHVPTGLLQLVFHPTDGTPIDLGRPFVTPAIQL
jgi:hypothetical protein